MKEKQLTCSLCGAALTKEAKREFYEQIMCEHCLDEQTKICECRNERIWPNNSESDGCSA